MFDYPLKRDLDGVYVRVQRERAENVCFTDMTKLEQEKFLNGLTESGLKQMCIHLAGALRRIGDELDVVVGEE